MRPINSDLVRASLSLCANDLKGLGFYFLGEYTLQCTIEYRYDAVALHVGLKRNSLSFCALAVGGVPEDRRALFSYVIFISIRYNTTNLFSFLYG